MVCLISDRRPDRRLINPCIRHPLLFATRPFLKINSRSNGVLLRSWYFLPRGNVIKLAKEFITPRDAYIKNRLEPGSPTIGDRRANGSDRLPLRSPRSF